MKNSLSALVLALVFFALPLSASAEFLVIKNKKPMQCKGMAIRVSDWKKITWQGFVVFSADADWQIFCGKDATNLPKIPWEKLTTQQQRAADATASQR
jgi:hypothetical protein